MPFPFKDKTLHFETLRALGYANSGGADVNEVLQLCARIREGNLDDWFREWRKAGLRAFSLGEESEKKNDNVSAKQAYLRASNYLRTAEFFRRDCPAQDKKALETFDQARDAMYRAMALSSEYDFCRFTIPFGDTNLPAYIIRPIRHAKANATIVMNGGFDSTKEECYLTFGASALTRGYNFIAFDGPGQGEVVRHQGIPFRPDWHRVVSAVTGAVGRLDGVDPARLVLLGLSMGGWLAAQAATEEHRYRALILNDGVFDFSAGWRRRTPWWVWRLHAMGATSLVHTAMALLARWGTIGQRWAWQNALFTFAATNGADLLDKVSGYCLTKETAQRIDCQMLILDPEDDHLLGGQPAELIENLGEHQRFDHVQFESFTGAGEHCELGAMAEQDRVIFNWLGTIL